MGEMTSLSLAWLVVALVTVGVAFPPFFFVYGCCVFFLFMVEGCVCEVVVVCQQNQRNWGRGTLKKKNNRKIKETNESQTSL